MFIPLRPMPGTPAPNPAASLMMLRVVWATLLMGEVVFAVIAAFITFGAGSARAPNPRLGNILLFIGGVMLVVELPIGYIIRGQIYKRHWQGNAIAPAGYFTGNLILLAMCEGIVFLGLVGWIVSRVFWPTILPALVALAIQLVNFPTGAPLRPDPFAAQLPDQRQP